MKREVKKYFFDICWILLLKELQNFYIFKLMVIKFYFKKFQKKKKNLKKKENKVFRKVWKRECRELTWKLKDNFKKLHDFGTTWIVDNKQTAPTNSYEIIKSDSDMWTSVTSRTFCQVRINLFKFKS